MHHENHGNLDYIGSVLIWHEVPGGLCIMEVLVPEQRLAHIDIPANT